MGNGTYKPKNVRLSLDVGKLVFPFLVSLLMLPCYADESSDRIRVEPECLPVKYIGNAETHKFHRPSCPFARIMAFNKRVEFHYRSQAVACAHIPCRYCLPKVWTTVRARLLSPAEQKQASPASPMDDPPVSDPP
ncbi:MAG: hypothetical protein C0507_23675 [Cyanobacteria bacterium PR.3.49]|nr:hypothetical protein [Cyanobacteria bacterium PR.3.49]